MVTLSLFWDRRQNSVIDLNLELNDAVSSEVRMGFIPECQKLFRLP